MTEKFGTIPYQHAEWLSKNRMADPVTGADSDGYLFQAITGGFHANFDGSVMEDVADDSGISVASVETKGDLIVCNDTVLNTTIPLPDVAKGRIFVSQGVGEIPIYATAPVAAAGAIPLCGAGADIAYVEPAAKGKFIIGQGVAAAPIYSAAAVSTAAGAVVIAGAGVDPAYVEPVAKGRLFVSDAVNTAPKYATGAVSTAAGAIPLLGAGVDVAYVEPVAANQCLMSNGVNVAPVFSPRFFSGVTAGGGQFVIAGLTAASRVVCTINSTLGNDLVFACAVPNAGGFIQFYVKDVTVAANVPDAAMADGIAVAVCVVTL